MENKEICVSIQAVQGGYILSGDCGTQVVVSLQKAIGILRNTLTNKLANDAAAVEATE